MRDCRSWRNRRKKPSSSGTPGRTYSITNNNKVNHFRSSFFLLVPWRLRFREEPGSVDEEGTDRIGRVSRNGP
ncbi:hypothetical protein DITRI_Ditri09bG0152600 [Diplodiscus trichospermus]